MPITSVDNLRKSIQNLLLVDQQTYNREEFVDFEKQLSNIMPRKSRRNKTPISQEMGEEIGNQILIEEIRKMRSEISKIQEDYSAMKEAISTQGGHAIDDAGLSTSNSESTLNDETMIVAPTFQPSKCSLTTFSGNESLKKFRAHLNDACCINNWHSQQEKGIWLKMCLEGRAREVLHDDIQDFDTIINRLATRFGTISSNSCQ